MVRVATLIVLLTAIPILAFADDDRATDAMIAHGLDLRRQGKPAEALEMFQRAHALAPSPRTAGQMGIVEGTLERWTDAEDHLGTALASPHDSWVRKNRALLDVALTTVKTHIGQLSFSGPAGATVTVAGKVAGTLPNVAPFRVGEGTVLVTATAPSTKQFVQSVTVQGGMQIPLAITLDPIDVRKPPEPSGTQPPTLPLVPELQSRYSWRAWTGGALMGVGAGLLGWGIVWIVSDGHGAGGSCAASEPSPCKPVYNTRTPGLILTAGGVVAGAVGGFFLYRARETGTDVTVGLGPSSVVLGGHF